MDLLSTDLIMSAGLKIWLMIRPNVWNRVKWKCCVFYTENDIFRQICKQYVYKYCLRETHSHRKLINSIQSSCCKLSFKLKRIKDKNPQWDVEEKKKDAATQSQANDDNKTEFILRESNDICGFVCGVNSNHRHRQSDHVRFGPASVWYRPDRSD